MSQVQTRVLGSDEAAPDIDVRISYGVEGSDAAIFNYQTDAAGNQTWPVPHFPPQRYTLHANEMIVNGGYNDKYKPRFASASVTVEPDANGNFANVRIDLERLPQVVEESGWLHIEGRDFVTDKGLPWQFRGYTVHYAINSMWPGFTHRTFDLEGVFDDMDEFGANTLVGIGMHASKWKFDNGWGCTPIEHPDYFTKLGELFDRAEDRKKRVAHAIMADMQHLPKNFDKQWFFRESCAVMAGRWNLLARKGNEMDHNGWHQNEYTYPDMRGVLCSQGSIGEDMPPRLPYLDWCEHELRRDLPKMFVDAPLRQVMDGDFNFDNGKRGEPTDRPTVSIEPIFFHDVNPDHVGDGRSTDPRVALELGLGTYACAGGAFGSSDSLECHRLQPHARYIASEYFRGLKAGFLRPLARLDFQGDH